MERRLVFRSTGKETEKRNIEQQQHQHVLHMKKRTQEHKIQQGIWLVLFGLVGLHTRKWFRIASAKTWVPMTVGHGNLDVE